MITFTVHYQGADYECTTYDDACEHAQMNWYNTDGAVTGGGYFCQLPDSEGNIEVRLVHLRVNEQGVARLAYTESVR